MKAVLSATEEQIKDYRLKLGDKIRIVREKRGYSLEQLAEKRGFFVFRQNGDHVEIINSPTFKAKVF